MIAVFFSALVDMKKKFPGDNGWRGRALIPETSSAAPGTPSKEAVWDWNYSNQMNLPNVCLFFSLFISYNVHQITLNPVAKAGQTDVWFWRWYEVYKSVYSLKSAFRITLMKPFKLENIKGMEVRDNPLHIWGSTCLFDNAWTVDCTLHRVCMIDFHLANNIAVFIL